MRDVAFRAATFADAGLLADLRIVFLEDFRGAQSPEQAAVLRAELVSYFERTLRSGEYIGWLAFVEQQAVGSGGAVIREYPGSFINPSGRSAYIMSIYTSPGFRRQGIAARLLRELQQDVVRAGVTVFELHAAPAGLNIYLADGFTAHDQPTMRKRIHIDALSGKSH